MSAQMANQAWEGAIWRTHFNRLIMRLADLRFPTIAAVDGPAVGAGMSLAVACTMVVAARGAYFEPSVALLGMVPDGGLTYYRPPKIGSAPTARN
jgi:2-(1,2-epoxy-1,2-dihydrophenyl)acetyl-CoA isomerase